MISFQKCTTTEELTQILTLQQANLPIAITKEEEQKEGFLTVDHDLTLLTKMNEVCPHIIAKKDRQVVGYALSMHPQFGDEIPVLLSMFEQMEKVSNDLKDASFLKNYLVMGQVCIDKAHRKQGIFRGLYQKMLNEYIPTFSCIVTEVNLRNTRSLEAHYAVGFELLYEHSSGGQDWALIYLK